MTIAHSLAATQDDMLHAAIDYAMRGWYVFPLEVGSKRPRARSHGLLDATNDLAIIERWWAESPDANVAISCGPSGLLVVDIDPRNGGELTWKRWTKDHPDHPLATASFAQAATAGGGLHYYYRLHSKARSFRKTRLGPGVDIQATGGYVVAPPSQTLAGSYRWLVTP